MRPYIKKTAIIAFRILLVLLVVEAGLRLSAYAGQSIQRSSSAFSSADSLVVLALGDSTTTDLHNGQSSWPKELENFLNERSDKSWMVINEATPSSSSQTIANNLEDYLSRHNPDFVIVMTGSNDYRIKQTNSSQSLVSGLLLDFRIVKVSQTLFLISQEKIKGIFIKTEEAKLKAAFAREQNAATFVALLKYYQSKNEPEKIISLTAQYSNEVASNSYLSYLAGDSYVKTGNYTAAKTHFTTALKLRAPDAETHEAILLGLADVYLASNTTQEAEKVLSAAQDLSYKIRNGNTFAILSRLINLDIQKGDLDDAYSTLSHFISKNTTSKNYVYWMGDIYEQMNKTEEVIPLFLQNLKGAPSNNAVPTELAWYYLSHNNTKEADAMFLLINATHEQALLEAYARVANRALQAGNQEIYLKYHEKMLSESNTFSPPTTANYLLIHQILEPKGIPLIAMQYPTLDVEALYGIFPRQANINYVSNEGFNEGVKASGYSSYFTDVHFGTFGHTTLKGNQLIAQNAAGVLLNLTA